MKHPDNNEYSPFGQYESVLSDFFAENAISAQPIPPVARLMGEALPEARNSFIDRIERKESIP